MRLTCLLGGLSQPTYLMSCNKQSVHQPRGLRYGMLT